MSLVTSTATTVIENARSRREQFATHGFTFARGLLSAPEVQHLCESLNPLLQTARAGVRNLLRRSSDIAALAQSERILSMIGELAGAVPFAVRGILFDKTLRANWAVAWHQDLTIAVNRRAEVPGFGPWSVKEGVQHAQAPAKLLERIFTVRIHLDDADETNGALRVIPGSHCSGKLDDAATDQAVAAGLVTICVVQAGDAFVMRPLLLHSSGPANLPRHRRVIHLEYATDELPPPLEWSERLG
jgi:ectoine hydroxylase-related dioxygenase (phytanoyl-CoA dioxygenase family)